ncbi:MAG TPA: efflux RND transporter periplasmic adaptor subunit [Gallionellaceae bacterium]
MTKPALRNIVYAAAALGVLLLAAVLFWPAPMQADLGRVEQGGMQVTVDEEGETRSHDRFVVTAPVAGKLARIELDDGDAVRENQVVAKIAPVPLSVREHHEQEARIAAAESQQRSAEEVVRHAQEDLAQAKRETARVARLVKDGFMSPQAAEQAQNAETTLANELEAARFRAKSAAAEVRLAKSGLVAGQGALFPVRSPVSGRILRIPDKSERVVAAGAPLLTVGDLSKLEVVIELLSSEAIKVKAGMPVILEGWGGSQPLKARVRMVEPYAYTKISALGVEEKRANVVADLVDPPQALGDGYRVKARIVVWAADQAIKVPASALFRCKDAWCAYTVENGRARRREVKIGQRNAEVAQVLSGLAPGEAVIRHPANQIEEGARVAP